MVGLQQDPRRIENDDEYQRALERIHELEHAGDDLELNGEMEAWANYVEDYEEREPGAPARIDARYPCCGSLEEHEQWMAKHLRLI